MIYFPHAKINLGLRILNKRKDGFHNIESLFLPIYIRDVLEIIPSNKFSFSYSGVDNIEGDNLCVQAYNKIASITCVPPVKIHLHKNIPIGAGIGGGSANATFTLTALNKQFNLGIPANKLFELALELGSDCPFFLTNEPKYVTGRGEIMKPIQLNLKGYTIVVINPGIHISTKEAYQNLKIKLRSNEDTLASIIKSNPISQWQNLITNDFETYAFYQYPEIANIKHQLVKKGAVYASMTGTGSTVYGFFKNNNIDFKKVFPKYFVYKAKF